METTNVRPQGQLRRLEYAKDLQSFFFTTTLQDSVQSYSVNQATLSDSAHVHPSPPNVFAIAPDSKLLLSASKEPPTTYLTNVSIHTPPITLRPDCSSSSVSAASFHPDCPALFLLAFADGTLAAYDAAHFFHDRGRGNRRSGPARSGAGGEVGHITKLHAVGSTDSPRNHLSQPFLDGYDRETGTVSIGDQDTCLTSIAFIPGSRYQAVSVGSDGKCCIVDFGTKPAMITRTWSLHGRATSLSILHAEFKAANYYHLDGVDLMGHYGLSSKEVVIAIGRQDGLVLLYNCEGNISGERSFDKDNGRVIDVDWLEGDPDMKSRSKNASPHGSISDSRAHNTASHRSGGIKPDDTSLLPDSLFTAPATKDAATQKNTRSYRPGSSGTVQKLKQRSRSVSGRKATSSGHTSKLSSRSLSKASEPNQYPPPIPPRPVPRKGGKLAIRRAETARMTDAAAQNDVQSLGVLRGKTLRKNASIVARAQRFQHERAGLHISNSPTGNDAESHHIRPIEDWLQASSGENPHVVSGDGWQDPEQRPTEEDGLTVQQPDLLKDAAVLPIDPQAALSSQNPNRKAQVFQPRPFSARHSEMSNYTVVDWSAGHPRPRSLLHYDTEKGRRQAAALERQQHHQHQGNQERKQHQQISGNTTIVEWSSSHGRAGERMMMGTVYDDANRENHLPSSLNTNEMGALWEGFSAPKSRKSPPAVPTRSRSRAPDSSGTSANNNAITTRQDESPIIAAGSAEAGTSCSLCTPNTNNAHLVSNESHSPVLKPYQTLCTPPAPLPKAITTMEDHPPIQSRFQPHTQQAEIILDQAFTTFEHRLTRLFDRQIGRLEAAWREYAVSTAEGMVVLEEENRRLRAELARGRRDRGKERDKEKEKGWGGKKERGGG